MYLPAEGLQTHRRHMRDYTRTEVKRLTAYDNVPGSSVHRHAAGERERYCWPAGLHRRRQICVCSQLVVLGPSARNAGSWK